MSRDATPQDVIEGRARWCVVCADNAEVLPTLPVQGVALVTDPPYGLGDLLERHDSEGRWKWGKHFKHAPEWDRAVPVGIPELAAQFQESIVWGGHLFGMPAARGWLIWDKIVRQFSSGHCELAWSNLDQPVRAFNFSHGELAAEGKNHPTQKPLALMMWCVGFTTAPVVLDPFCGSGTTGVACLRLGRRFIGIEKDAHYAAIARDRLDAESRGLTLRDLRHGQRGLFETGA